MTELRAKKVGRWMVELAAIQAEVELLREEEQAEPGSLLSGLEVDAMAVAGNAIEMAISVLKEMR